VDEQSGSKKSLIGVVLLAAAVALGMAYWPKTDAQKPPEMVKQEPPKQPDPPATEPQPDEVKATLLGLNEKPTENAAGIFKPKARKRVMRRRAVAEDTAQSGEDENNDGFNRPQIGLSDADFHSTIERWRGMKSCLNTHKGRVDESRGALRISMKIMSSGEVAESNVFDESNEIAKLIAPCVEKQARQLKFPSFEGEPFAMKEAKFVF
jgi:hypothetical protein